MNVTEPYMVICAWSQSLLFQVLGIEWNELVSQISYGLIVTILYIGSEIIGWIPETRLHASSTTELLADCIKKICTILLQKLKRKLE
jgi:hypothetical protein